MLHPVIPWFDTSDTNPEGLLPYRVGRLPFTDRRSIMGWSIVSCFG